MLLSPVWRVRPTSVHLPLARSLFATMASLRQSAPAAASRLPPTFAAAGVVRVDAAEGVVRGASDERRYRALTLRSGVRALLVSDPKADKAAAALSVGVGHLADPRGIAGLAHAVEHMLFLGSGKYPEEGEYKAFLKGAGGGCNASTGADATTYHFFVHPSHLAGALDRFARFFIEPLFTPSGTGRELHAINSENDKNVQDDGRRALQVRKHLAAPGHDWSKFGTGNLATLRDAPAAAGVDVRDALIAHYRAHYAPCAMTLAVLGREGLDELAALVTGGGPLGTDFGDVPARAAEAPPPAADQAVEAVEPHPYPRSRTGRAAFIAPVRDLRSLQLVWPAPHPRRPDYVHAHRLVSHLLGHEGAGSVLAALKARGWATALSASTSAYRRWATFEVSVSLTPEGLARADDVVATIYAYVRLLRAAPVGTLRAAWEEVAQAACNGVRFRPQESPVSAVTSLATRLADYPAADALVAPSLLSEFDWPATAAALALLAPDNMLLLRSAKEDGAWVAAAAATAAEAAEGNRPDAGLAPVVTAHVEPAYGMTYHTAPFTAAQLAAWGGGGDDYGATAAAGAEVDLPPAVVAQAQLNGWRLVPMTPAADDGAPAAVVPAPGPTDIAPPVQLHLPAPNPFLPTDFTVKPLEAAEDGVDVASMAAEQGRAAVAGGGNGTPAVTAAPEEPAVAAVTHAANAVTAPSVEGATALARAADEGTAAADVEVDVVVTPAVSNGNGGAVSPTSVAPTARPYALPPHPLDAPFVGGGGGSSDAGQQALPPLEVTPKYPVPAQLQPLGAVKGDDGDQSDPAVEAWHLQDATFRLPRTYVFAQLRPPVAGASPGATPRSRLLSSLLVSCLHDVLAVTTYDADVAGLHYDVAAHPDAGGFELSVAGYSHKAPVLLRRVAGALADFDGAMGCGDGDGNGDGAAFRAVFARRLDALRRGLANNSKAQPYVRARQLAAAYLMRGYVPPEVVLAELEAGVSPGELRAYARGVVSAGSGSGDSGAPSRRRPSLLTFVYGNVTAADSRALAGELSATLLPGSSSGSSSDGNDGNGVLPAAVAVGTESGSSNDDVGDVDDDGAPRALLLPAGTEAVVTRAHPNPGERNAAVHVVWQLGAATHRTIAAGSLLAMLASQPAFDALRTKEQLGYLVFSGLDVTHGAGVSFTITVQSSVASVGHLGARIDAFVSALRGIVAAMPPEELVSKAAILAHRMTEADKTHGAEAGRLWGALASPGSARDWHFAEATAAALLQGGGGAGWRTALLALCDDALLPGGRHLRMLTTRVHPQPAAAAAVADAAAAEAAAAPAAAPLLGGGPAAVEAHPHEAPPCAASFHARVLGAGGRWLPTPAELAAAGADATARA